jgi:hypothetical protein
MATVVTWHCRNQAAMVYKSAVKEPKRRTCGGKVAGALGAAGATTALGGTQPHNSVAPISIPAAWGLRVCSKAAVAGSGRDNAGLRRGITSSRMRYRKSHSDPNFLWYQRCPAE